MNELQIFNSEQFGKIRAVKIDGEPWFCLADVCKPLGLRVADCKKRLKLEGVDTINTPTNSGIQGMIYVNEGNLYRTVFQSKKPEAEAFIDWVTEEVLPALRRTGTYSLPGAAPRRIPDVSPSGLAKLITVTRRVMLDMGNSPVEIGAMTKSVLETWGIPVPLAFSNQIPGQLCLFNIQAMEG